MNDNILYLCFVSLLQSNAIPMNLVVYLVISVWKAHIDVTVLHIAWISQTNLDAVSGNYFVVSLPQFLTIYEISTGHTW